MCSRNFSIHRNSVFDCNFILIFFIFFSTNLLSTGCSGNEGVGVLRLTVIVPLIS